MKFNLRTQVEGKYIMGTIDNKEFSLNMLINKGRTLAPLQINHSFNSQELGELINELQLVKNNIDNKFASNER